MSSCGRLLATMWLVAIPWCRQRGDASACSRGGLEGVAARGARLLGGGPDVGEPDVVLLERAGQSHGLGEAGEGLVDASGVDEGGLGRVVELARGRRHQPVHAHRGARRGKPDQGERRLAVEGHERVEVDELGHAVRHLVESAGDHHAAVGVPEEDDVAVVLVQQVVHDVLDVSAQPDLGAREVGPLAEPGQARGEALVAGRMEQPAYVPEPVGSAPATVDQDGGRHGSHHGPIATASTTTATTQAQQLPAAYGGMRRAAGPCWAQSRSRPRVESPRGAWCSGALATGCASVCPVAPRETSTGASRSRSPGPCCAGPDREVECRPQPRKNMEGGLRAAEGPRDV